MNLLLSYGLSYLSDPSITIVIFVVIAVIISIQINWLLYRFSVLLHAALL
jgi:hypothetical protein